MTIESKDGADLVDAKSLTAPKEQQGILQGRTPKLDTTYVIKDGVLIRWDGVPIRKILYP